MVDQPELTELYIMYDAGHVVRSMQPTNFIKLNGREVHFQVPKQAFHLQVTGQLDTVAECNVPNTCTTGMVPGLKAQLTCVINLYLLYLQSVSEHIPVHSTGTTTYCKQ